MKQFKLALVECEKVYKIFENIYNDQFDFHNYSIKKSTFITYLEMLEWKGNLRRHNLFINSSKYVLKFEKSFEKLLFWINHRKVSRDNVDTFVFSSRIYRKNKKF